MRTMKTETMGGKRDLDYMKNPHPANFVAAEFSLPYSMAVALAGLNPGPDWISEKTMSDKIILETAAKAECSFLRKKAETRNADELHKWPATVNLTLKDGSIFSSSVKYPKGSPRNRLTDEELTTKFIRLATHVITEETARMAANMINQLEKIGDVSELTSLISEGHR